MRIHSKVADERSDMLGDIQIPNCEPKDLRTITERIMNMCLSPGYACPVETSVSELDKLLTLDYWWKYNNILTILTHGDSYNDFKKWYVKSATDPDLISRARRWLYQHHYIFYEPNVAERSAEAAEKFSQAIKGR